MLSEFDPGAQAMPDAERRRLGQVVGAPSVILRVEGLMLFVAATVAYGVLGGSWWVFAALFLAPDLFMLGYLVDMRLGAALYNLGHSTIVPAAIAGLGYAIGGHFAIAVGLIWLAHIGMDRAVGYGLKYPDAFKNTHLGAPFAKAPRD